MCLRKKVRFYTGPGGWVCLHGPCDEELPSYLIMKFLKNPRVEIYSKWFSLFFCNDSAKRFVAKTYSQISQALIHKNSRKSNEIDQQLIAAFFLIFGNNYGKPSRIHHRPVELESVLNTAVLNHGLEKIKVSPLTRKFYFRSMTMIKNKFIVVARYCDIEREHEIVVKSFESKEVATFYEDYCNCYAQYLKFDPENFDKVPIGITIFDELGFGIFETWPVCYTKKVTYKNITSPSKSKRGV